MSASRPPATSGQPDTAATVPPPDPDPATVRQQITHGGIAAVIANIRRREGEP